MPRTHSFFSSIPTQEQTRIQNLADALHIVCRDFLHFDGGAVEGVAGSPSGGAQSLANTQSPVIVSTVLQQQVDTTSVLFAK